MRYEYYSQRINKDTRGRYDVTALYADSAVLKNLVKDILAPFDTDKIDKIAGIDALGFVLGGAAAQRVGKGFVAVRKGNKLPGRKSTILKTSFTDYTRTSKSLELSTLTLKKGDRILIVDEWIETGAQMKATVRLIERAGGVVFGIACLNAERKQSTEVLFSKYNLKPIHVQR